MVVLFPLDWMWWNQFYRYHTNGRGKTSSYNELRQMGQISLQRDLKLEACLRISDLHFHWRVPFSECVMLFFNQACCVSVQYRILEGCCERILIPWTQAMDHSLPDLSWLTTLGTRLGISIYYLSITGIVVRDRCFISLRI